MGERKLRNGFVSPTIAAYIQSTGRWDRGLDFRCLPMEELERAVCALLNPNRVAHVLGCRDTAVALAERWGADVTDAARAALLHDITKVFDGPSQLTLAQEYGIMLSDFSAANPKTLHALTGAYVARDMFGENDAVFHAIESHTTGKANMNLLETIIYVADYMEPTRDFPGVEQLRRLATVDMEQALQCGLEITLAHLKEQNAEVSPESREALQYLYQKKLTSQKG